MSKKKHEEEHENHERWLVSYADFITLLFAFFTVLYATSQRDVKKEQEFEQAVRKAFSGMVDFGGDLGAGEFTRFDKNMSFVPTPAELYPRPNDVDEVEEPLEELTKELKKEEIGEDEVDLRHDAVGVRISFASAALFATGSAKLKQDALRSLDKVGAVLKKFDRKLIVEGHTDDVPFKSDRFGSNWELSAARATAIVRYLILQHKIEPRNLVAVAYADQKPRARNRRIEIFVTKSKTIPDEQAL